MIDQELLIQIGLFVAAVTVVLGLSRLVTGGSTHEARVRRRLDGVGEGQPAGRRPGKAVATLVNRVSAAAAKPLTPKSAEEQSALRRRLGYAGLYSAGAMRALIGAKLILMVAGLAVGYLAAVALDARPSYTLLAPVILAILGLLGPELWLLMAIRREQTAIEHGLPDALDLLVVCVESGLTMDAAVQRVSKEIVLVHPSLARELAITHVETQMGVPRAEAMRKLAARTGSKALKSLTAMLIQADRFGTSIAGALRIYSDSLRTKRQMAAQEMAGKASVKMTLPLVFCIFPAILAVAGGPAMIQLYQMMQRR